jgi:hypothetical protein
LAEIDLVERLQPHVRLRIAVKKDGREIDLEKFRRSAVGDVAAHDLDVPDLRAGRQAAHALEKVQHGFRPLIRDRTLAAGHFAKKI